MLTKVHDLSLTDSTLRICFTLKVRGERYIASNALCFTGVKDEVALSHATPITAFLHPPHGKPFFGAFTIQENGKTWQ